MMAWRLHGLWPPAPDLCSLAKAACHTGGFKLDKLLRLDCAQARLSAPKKMAQRPPSVRDRLLSDRHIAAQYEFKMHEQADAHRSSKTDARPTSMAIGRQLAMATGGDQIIDHELWGTLRAALVSVSDEVQFLLQLGLSPEAWSLDGPSLLAQALQRHAPRSWPQLEQTWADRCSEWSSAQPGDGVLGGGVGGGPRPSLASGAEPQAARRASEIARASMEALGRAAAAAHESAGSRLRREQLAVALRRIAAGHVLMIESDDEDVPGVGHLAWLEIRPAPLDAEELLAVVTDGVLNERYEVRHGVRPPDWCKGASPSTQRPGGSPPRSPTGGSPPRSPSPGPPSAPEEEEEEDEDEEEEEEDIIECSGAALLKYLLECAREPWASLDSTLAEAAASGVAEGGGTDTDSPPVAEDPEVGVARPG